MPSLPHPSPVESEWSDEDWKGEKQKAKEEGKRKQDLQAQQKEEDVTKDYCPSSPLYDPTFKQDPLPHCTPKVKMTLDPNYYLPRYIPDEHKKDNAPLLVNNLVNPLEKTPQKTPWKKRKKKRFQ